MSNKVKLIILPALRATISEQGDIFLTEKFLDGVAIYKNLWLGQVTVMMEGTQEKYVSKSEKIVMFNPKEATFNLEIVSYADLTASKLQAQPSIVLASVNSRLNRISRLCSKAKIPCVYVSEYSLKTRKQIISLDTKNPLKIFKRTLLEYLKEKQQRKGIAISQGIQCNGTPTYNAYKEINPNPLLYFDNRVEPEMLATKEDIERRYSSREANSPLNLAFSGRLTKIKGAEDLLDIAEELKKSGVNFVLYIFGDGDVKEKMESIIANKNMKNFVKMMGYLDFKKELIPYIINNIDLFVCCHRQGDPSCTYLETMSCGVPIIGYANEAFEGLVAHTQIGWVTPMNKPKLLANKIAELAENIDYLKQMSLKSLEFAEFNCFDKTFKNRIHHLDYIAEQFYSHIKK